MDINLFDLSKDLSLTVKENQRFFEGRCDSEYTADLVSEVVLQMSTSYIATRYNFLDVGAGNGALIKSFRHYWRNDWEKRIEGIDIAPKNAVVKKGDCTKMNYDDSSFDGVFCMDVIEHLQNDDLALCINEIARILRKGGILILTTTNQENLSLRVVTCPKCGHRFHVCGHCQVFTKEQIKKILKDFRILKIRELNLGLVAVFGIYAKLFYFLGLHKLKPVHRITSDLFIVAKKI